MKWTVVYNVTSELSSTAKRVSWASWSASLWSGFTSRTHEVPLGSAPLYREADTQQCSSTLDGFSYRLRYRNGPSPSNDNTVPVTMTLMVCVL